MSTLVEKYSYLQDWKDKMTEVIRLQYSEEELSDKKISKYLDSQIEKHLKNPNTLIVNNYTNKVSRVTVLELIDLIRKNNLVCSGGGCLFLPHNMKRNILIEFILYIMDGRNAAKKRRKNFEKGTDEWEEADRDQLAFKLVINSLYGCLGYPGFIMFNIFLAEAITNQGRNIITSAINAIENFLGDSIWFTNESEVYHYINTIDNEFFSRAKGRLSDETLVQFAPVLDLKNLPKLVTERLVKHCIFAYDKKFVESLYSIFSKMSVDELIIMYYKNNFMEFNRTPFMKYKFKALILANGPLSFCEDWCYKDDTCRAMIDEIWKFYDLFVHYDYPIHDRMQKAMYIDKNKSLYTDTDSVFISLDEFVKYIENEVFTTPAQASMSEKDLIFTAANVALTIANRMIDRTMKTLCKSLQITDEFAKLLKMKNEFFMSRIMFTDVKKRYISLALLQEGQLLNDGNGLPEIKGFDFIKAGTKPFVKNYYTKLCLEEILYPKEIKPQRIFRKVLDLKKMMEDTIMTGNMEFFKQANVKKPEYYKNPYSTQGVCAIMLWNALCPEYAIQFPSDVNIVPIKDLTYEKPSKKNRTGDAGLTRLISDKNPTDFRMIKWYSEKYPEAYDNLYNNIYTSGNPLIRHMNLSSIAIPKNLDVELPEYITELFDVSSIINDTISLILPILKGVGVNSFQVTSTQEYMSNMISL